MLVSRLLRKEAQGMILAKATTVGMATRLPWKRGLGSEDGEIYHWDIEIVKVPPCLGLGLDDVDLAVGEGAGGLESGED